MIVLRIACFSDVIGLVMRYGWNSRARKEALRELYDAEWRKRGFERSP